MTVKMTGLFTKYLWYTQITLELFILVVSQQRFHNKG